jgi:hypothetical protein
MLALVLAVGAEAGWIIFDIVVSVVTYPLLPLGKWRVLVGSGAILVIATIIARILEFRGDQQVERRHTEEHELLASAAIKTLEMGSNFPLLVQRLENLTNTQGKPLVTTIEVANRKIERLESKVSRHDAIFWGALDRDDREHLTAVLSRLGPHSVRIVADANTDCVELARDLKACFKEAAWPIDGVPLTGTYQAAGASGLSVVFKYGCEEIQRPLVEALSAVAHGQCSGLGTSPSDTPKPDVSIIIGPKRLHYDD